MKVVIEYQRYVQWTESNTLENEERVFKWKIKDLTQEINTTKVDLEMWRKDYLGHVLLMEDYNNFSFPMTDEIWLTELTPIQWSKWTLPHGLMVNGLVKTIKDKNIRKQGYTVGLKITDILGGDGSPKAPEVHSSFFSPVHAVDAAITVRCGA